ncbi:hypothetical protein CLV30_110157 [Haloactinopolyspora alba]|uniref:Uncharacterized protein n=1 Tax=Haloactinopolyspora alba TaxID=648780 RepID=A0A2P8DZ58_9ACTN|nr:hypothetical protein [Haloactinopolyspora alba]PSL02503.1 hypothetical protein CLV30_110157 [Haloactinopolyspora alba]
MSRRDGLVRDRDGDLVDEPVEHVCVNGWAGEDHAGRPIACHVCRPHLQRRRLAGDGPEITTARPDPHEHRTSTT